MFLTEASFDDYYYRMQPSNPLGCDTMGPNYGVRQLGKDWSGFAKTK